MEQIQKTLMLRLISKLKKDPQQQIMVGIAGVPGSGKSTIAKAMMSSINRCCRAKNIPDVAAVLPMDGFHYTKQQLSQMPNPVEAFARRGAPWTFDGIMFVKAVETLKKTCTLLAPSFDHGQGDPVENGVVIQPHHKIVLVEGNYLLLDDQPWHKLKNLFDETWFVDCKLEAAMDRVFIRQVGNGLRESESEERIRTNDQPNAELVIQSRRNADLIVPSVQYRDPFTTLDMP